MDDRRPDRIALIEQVATAWLNNPDHRIDTAELPTLLRKIGEGIDAALAPPVLHPPAVSIEASLASNDHILSMIDGKPYKGLTRHIATHGLTPDEYRARYCLPPHYPMVSPAYSAKRRAAAKKLGLGRHIRPRGEGER
ncbi:MucR family transcriptional regulator [Sphingomonas sp. 3-13AW]|jgi:predicted transcriptional regulator|uniref:MucR family transcriptional regulator n=1 Tax=Sphingomonas sp. 3-13AW TaxID=3050450 RepID=UPI003BB63177